MKWAWSGRSLFSRAPDKTLSPVARPGCYSCSYRRMDWPIGKELQPEDFVRWPFDTGQLAAGTPIGTAPWKELLGRSRFQAIGNVFWNSTWSSFGFSPAIMIYRCAAFLGQTNFFLKRTCHDAANALSWYENFFGQTRGGFSTSRSVQQRWTGWLEGKQCLVRDRW